jgi:hypothetical protein
MGHRDIATTQRYAPSAREAELIAAAFAPNEVLTTHRIPAVTTAYGTAGHPCRNRA